ncbi:polysaccharide deacetylase family protein [Schumannella luteola]
MRRRSVLAALGLAGLGAIGAFGAGELFGATTPAPAALPPLLRAGRTPRLPLRPAPAAVALPPHFFPPAIEKLPAVYGSISDLPGDGNLLALTVDDGGDADVIAAYARWVAECGMRVTFFLNGSLPGWAQHADLLLPLVQNGQVQLANHTWTHTSLPTLSDDGIRNDLSINDAFIRDTFGVEAKPYFRPPFGHIDDRVQAAAASIGYTVPVMWYGSLADATPITDADLLAMANDWLLPQHIVIGHANYPTVTYHFREIADILRSRGLQPVTLDDVWERP